MSSGKKKILIVDDDADFRSTVKEVLETKGFEVSSAVTGKEGLKKALAEHPALIILDIMMENEWAGYELNQAIKHGEGSEALSSTPILMVSSIQTDPQTLFSRSAEGGMVTPNAYMTKPLDIKQFLSQVEAFVGHDEDDEKEKS